MLGTQKKIDSKIGALYLVASAQGLRGLFLSQPDVPMINAQDSQSLEAQIFAKTEQQLAEYFAGQRQEFNLPLDIIGTEFQKLVWQQLLKIPYGKTASYKDIAICLKNEKASRAVGTANGKNPLSIIIPCHRVIAADGSLGGYSGGLGIKKKLLDLEQNLMA